LSSMTDASGNSILDSPKTLTIRANGETSKVNVSSDMSLEDFTDAIETAVTKSIDDGGLGLTGSTFGFDITKGQIIFESGMSGTKGELSLAADESLLKALGMQITTESVDAAYKISATTTGVSNVTTSSGTTTTGSANGIVKGLKLDFALASEARIDGTVEAQAMITVPGATSMDPGAGTPAFNANNDVIFQIYDTNANTSEQANGAGTVTAGITVRLTAGRSYTMNSISTIINTLVAGANDPDNSLAKIMERPSGVVENPDTSSNMAIPSFRASFDGYNLQITSGVSGSSGSISILANPAATAVLGLQSGRVLGDGGSSALITGSTDLSAGLTLAGTGVLRIRVFDGDYRTNAVGGNTTSQVTDDITFQRGTAISATSIVDTFNNQFTSDGLDITASLNSSGQLEFRSGETGGDAKISIAAVGTSVGMTNLGLVANQNSIGQGGNAAVFTGQTASNSSTNGFVLTGGFRFNVTDALGASSGLIHFGSDSIDGPGFAANSGGLNFTNSGDHTTKSFSLSKADIGSIMDASNISSTDVEYSFDAAGRLDFSSRSVGEDSRIV
ncbi:hypothetical protein MJH12_18175, partial [bacterium]|nr:hypothetical protein [bacterium]